ncbi:hypothetical protein [Candidatus Tisiphia endosymbiont of Metellina segmentata]
MIRLADDKVPSTDQNNVLIGVYSKSSSIRMMTDLSLQVITRRINLPRVQ